MAGTRIAWREPRPDYTIGLHRALLGGLLRRLLFVSGDARYCLGCPHVAFATEQVRASGKYSVFRLLGLVQLDARQPPIETEDDQECRADENPQQGITNLQLVEGFAEPSSAFLPIRVHDTNSSVAPDTHAIDRNCIKA